MHSKDLKHGMSGTFFSKETLSIFSFSQATPSSASMAGRVGAVCEKEKTYRVLFEKMSLTWHVLDLWCASTIVQVPR
jgi:hypothetical protein